MDLWLQERYGRLTPSLNGLKKIDQKLIIYKFNIMPKSRQRKNHKQKVENRNNLLKGVRRKMEKEYTEMLEKQLQQYQEQMSAMTEENNSEVVDVTPI
jgi:single-stranded DNA-specific DHH superfamily exonuclease